MEQGEIEQFRFYISGIQLHFSDGTVFSEINSYHLIDMEEPASQHLTLHTENHKEINSISFIVGTDSITNVSGALDGDLDPIKGMYWAWNTGYINFKLEGIFNKINFEYHIGGYLSPYSTARVVTFQTHNLDGELRIQVKPFDFLNKLDMISTPSVLIPGETASNLADLFQQIFVVNE